MTLRIRQKFYDPVTKIMKITNDATNEILGFTALTLETGEAAPTVRSKLLLVEFRRDKQRGFAGTCLHHLVRRGDGLAIAGKRVDLVNCDGVLEGLVVPF